MRRAPLLLAIVALGASLPLRAATPVADDGTTPLHGAVHDSNAEEVRRLLKAGDRDAAMQRWQDVRGLIQKARDQGLSHEELAHAFSRARLMLEQIEAVKR